MKLHFDAMQILMAELQPKEMSAIYNAIHSIGVGKDIVDTVSKQDLIKMIGFLCQKLGWIEYYEEVTKPPNPSEKEANLKTLENESTRGDANYTRFTKPLNCDANDDTGATVPGTTANDISEIKHVLNEEIGTNDEEMIIIIT